MRIFKRKPKKGTVVIGKATYLLSYASPNVAIMVKKET